MARTKTIAQNSTKHAEQQYVTYMQSTHFLCFSDSYIIIYGFPFHQFSLMISPKMLKYRLGTTGENIVFEHTYTYIYKQGIQLQYERYT